MVRLVERQIVWYEDVQMFLFIETKIYFSYLVSMISFYFTIKV